MVPVCPYVTFKTENADPNVGAEAVIEFTVCPTSGEEKDNK